MTARMIRLSALGLGVLAAAGLGVLAYAVPPSPPWIALALLLIALTVMGLSASVWGLIVHKLAPKSSAESAMLMGLRLGLWTGLFVASVLLLQLLGFTDRVLILVILALLIMIETFLQQNAARKKTGKRSRRR